MVSEASWQRPEGSPAGSNPPHTGMSVSQTLNEPTDLEQAVRKKFKSLTAATGELVMPCVPAMLDDHIRYIEQLMRALGQDLKPLEIESLRQTIATKLAEGFRLSPHARLSVKYGPPSPTEGLTSGLKISATVMVSSIEDKYQGWVNNRSGPLFGSYPDAKIMDVAAIFAQPQQSPILDVGAGTGRNTFPLARRGHPVDAIELTPVFAQQLFKAAQTENLPVRIIQGNVLDPKLNLPSAYYKLAMVSEVISHFRNINQVRVLLAKLCAAVQTDGFLLFNVFLAVDGYQPDSMVRQMAEVVWSYLLTREELRFAMAGLPLEIISDESAYEYEQRHLPKEAWPPTSWFLGWATGRNIFPIEQNPPIELRWILCRRK